MKANSTPKFNVLIPLHPTRLEQADGEDAEGAWRLLDTDDGDRDAAVRVAWLDDMDWVAPGVRQLASSALCFRVVSDERHVRMSSSVLLPSVVEVAPKMPDGDTQRHRRTPSTERSTNVFGTLDPMAFWRKSAATG